MSSDLFPTQVTHKIIYLLVSRNPQQTILIRISLSAQGLFFRNNTSHRHTDRPVGIESGTIWILNGRDAWSYKKIHVNETRSRWRVASFVYVYLLKERGDGKWLRIVFNGVCKNHGLKRNLIKICASTIITFCKVFKIIWIEI